ncbi:hypothetical protein GYMLUDRAFT_53024 [Collybiopsis luxurians FD-317 M1]|nr:hypothetical protein GYMLUDRAFT_53024 [Collybiopsis luxurians FD-317 M1]
MSESGDVSPDDAEVRIAEIIQFLRKNRRLSSIVKCFTLDARSSDTLVRASSSFLSELPFRELTSFGIVMFPLGELKQPGLTYIEELLKLNNASLSSLAFELTGIAHPVQTLFKSCTPTLRNLRHLYLHDIGIYSACPELPETPAGELQQLDTLRIGGWYYASSFLPDLFSNTHASLGLSSRLHTLQISTNLSLNPYCQLCFLCGESLRNLELSIALTEVTESHRVPFNMLQNLESLHITFNERYSPNGLSLLLDIFSSRPALKQLKLNCSHSAAQFVNRVRTILTAEVDDALEAFILRSLKLENVILALPENLYDQVSSWGNLVEMIPMATRTGLMHLEHLSA